MLVHCSKQLLEPACCRSMLYAINPHFKNPSLNLVISCIHLENCSGMGWHSASQKWRHTLLGQFPLLLLRWLLWRREQIVQVPAKSCKHQKRESLAYCSPLVPQKELCRHGIDTWIYTMAMLVNHCLTTGPVLVVQTWAVAVWATAHGPFCAIKQAWPSRTPQLLISVGPQEQNQSTFIAFSKLWFPVYVVCPNPNSWSWFACMSSSSATMDRKQGLGSQHFWTLLPAPWCWQSTGGNECHWVINSLQRALPLGRWRSRGEGLEQHSRDTPVVEWALPQCRVITPAGCCWVLPTL